MKVLIINGSPRKKGVTAKVLHRIEDNLMKYNIEVIFYNLGEINMSHCTGCQLCYKTGDCFMDDDAERLSKIISEVDGVVLGSPTYASNVSGMMKDFIDRGHFVIEQLLHDKYCMTVATGENYGNKNTLKVLNELVIFSGGRLTGNILVKTSFNDIENNIRKMNMRIEKLSKSLITGIKYKRIYIFQKLFHFIIFRFGIKPFVEKKGSSYLGVIKKWRESGVLN